MAIPKPQHQDIIYTGFARDVDEFNRRKKILHDFPDYYREIEMRETNAQIHQDITTDVSIENVPLHNHTFYEVMFCWEGEITYLLNQRRYRIKKGDVIVIPPGISHQPLFNDDFHAPYNRLILWMRPKVPEALLIGEILADDAFVLRGDRCNTESIGALFMLACREGSDRLPGWDAAVLGLALQIMVRIHRLNNQREPSEAERQTPELLDRIVQYIDENLSRKITLGDTARAFLVSESTITKLFRAVLNESFYRFVTQRRLLKAKTMLSEGMELQEIYTKVGYSDYSAFFRAFKQEVGITPNQYRSFLR